MARTVADVGERDSDAPKDWDEFARLVERIRGVVSADVQEDPEVTVRLTATKDRPAKEVARDVQSLAAAGFGLRIDHRSISVTTVEVPDLEEPADRPVISWINVITEKGRGRVDVGIRWKGVELTGGAHAGTWNRRSRATAAAEAARAALEPEWVGRGVTVVIESVQIVDVASREWVLVGALTEHGGIQNPILGTALAQDDSAAAGARAFLDAANRTLTR